MSAFGDKAELVQQGRRTSTSCLEVNAAVQGFAATPFRGNPDGHGKAPGR